MNHTFIFLCYAHIFSLIACLHCLCHQVSIMVALKEVQWPSSPFLKELLVRSKRRWVLSTIELVEEDPGPFPKIGTQVKTSYTTKQGTKFRISGTGVTEEPIGVFSIGDTDGVVYVHKSIDRETYPIFHINFDIMDKETGNPVDRTLGFDVAIKDINDNAPYFENLVTKASVKESLPEGLAQSILNQTVRTKPISRCVWLRNQVTMVVEAKDHGKPALSSTAVVNLHIMDSNTHQPVFKNKTVMEMESNREILRVAVTDADTPNTPAWRAVYSIVKGNEEGNYKIETDPKTNEGILTVIKVSLFDLMTLYKVLSINIAVENEEPLFVCGSGGPNSPKTLTALPQTVNVAVKVIDVNDPPEFDKKVVNVYVKEEEVTGMLLYTPKVTDVDSDVGKIRYELVEDPAGWVTIDNKTGAVTTVKKMDRESPHVNKDNIYTILIHAIDDGKPPATATCTILVHLGDINDNVPSLAEKELVMCGNKVIVPVEDKDKPPFGCPCSFSLGVDNGDKTLKSHWKLDPANGMEAGLVSLKTLAYGNYTVPLVILDQQGQEAHDIVQVIVCDCGKGDKCRASLHRTVTLWLCVPLPVPLLFLLLCECGGKTFTHLPLNLQEEGNQTLIKYNEEAGGSACKVCVGVYVHVHACMYIYSICAECIHEVMCLSVQHKDRSVQYNHLLSCHL
uniref:Cadherin 26, tandem duplicate 1 n=1 Tax=Salmo trutta TaxID=8032 RepID=A0A674F1A8_SALTR